MSPPRTRWSKAVYIANCLLLLVAVILWLVTPKFEETVVDDGERAESKLLFVGNSLLFKQKLSLKMVQIARAGNVDSKLLVRQVAYPEYTLKNHWRRERALKVIEGQTWDYVILQPKSTETLMKPEETAEYFRKFAAEIEQNQAKPVLFMTWLDRGKQEIYPKIAPLFQTMAEKNKALLAPVATAVNISVAEHPDIELFEADGHNLSTAGAYLASATVYATIFRKPPALVENGDFPQLSGAALPELEVQKTLRQVVIEAMDRAGAALEPEPERNHGEPAPSQDSSSSGSSPSSSSSSSSS